MAIALSTVAAYCGAVIWYCYLIYVGGVNTVLATWVMFLATVVAGFLSYMRSPGSRHWSNNVCNAADVVATCAVVVFLLVCGNMGFRKFDLLCLGLWLVVVAGWMVSKNPRAANVAFNVLLVVAYAPLVEYLARGATENTEPYGTWVTIFLASLVGLVNPVRKRDWLALLYAARASISTAAVLVLMLRLDGYL